MSISAKHCRRCETTQPVERFNRDRSRGDGLHPYCKACRKAEDIRLKERRRQRRLERYAEDPSRSLATNKRWRDANKDKVRSQKLRAAYGIDSDEFEAMSERQGHVCAICLQPETQVRKGQIRPLAVDHDHETGRVRALLCHIHNAGIGAFQDDPALLERAAAYVRGFR